LGLPRSVPPYRTIAIAPLFLFDLSEGGRLFRAHVIKHARKNRNVGIVLEQHRTELRALPSAYGLVWHGA
jgi:hypothetical protein